LTYEHPATQATATLFTPREPNSVHKANRAARAASYIAHQTFAGLRFSPKTDLCYGRRQDGLGLVVSTSRLAARDMMSNVAHDA